MTLQFDELMRDTYSSEANFEYGILHRTDITSEMAGDLLTACPEIFAETARRSPRAAGEELKHLWEAAAHYRYNVPVNLATDKTSHIGDRSESVPTWLQEQMPGRYLTTTGLSDSRHVHFRDAADATAFATEGLGLRPWDRYRFPAPKPSDIFKLPDFFNPTGMHHRFHSLIFPILMGGYRRSREREPVTFPAGRPNGHSPKMICQRSRLQHGNLARHALDKLLLIATAGYTREDLLCILGAMFVDNKRYYVPCNPDSGLGLHDLPVLFSHRDDAMLFRHSI
jgi:hypothetical protein